MMETSPARRPITVPEDWMLAPLPGAVPTPHHRTLITGAEASSPALQRKSDGAGAPLLQCSMSGHRGVHRIAAGGGVEQERGGGGGAGGVGLLAVERRERDPGSVERGGSCFAGRAFERGR